MTFEVRCCCQPQKLLGYLNVDGLDMKTGGLVRFALMRGSVPVSPESTCDVVTLRVRMFYNDGDGTGRPRVYPAISSEETPLDILKRIPRFTPVIGRSTFNRKDRVEAER